MYHQLLLAVSLMGCKEVTKVLESEQLQDLFDETTEAFSGTYWVGFEHGGDHFGLGRFELEEGRFIGDVVSGQSYHYEFELYLQEDGTLELADLETGDPADISFSWASLTGDLLEGGYLYNGEEGTFAGSLNNQKTDDAVETLYDGAYEAVFWSGDEEQGATVLVIEGGAFELEYIGIDDVEYIGTGFVTSDGTMVMQDVLTSEDEVVMAEGHIDQDTFRLEGLWRVGDRTGGISGRRAD
jgi:hypothetical protein